MSLITDLVLLAVFFLCIFMGWKKGFVKTLSGFMSYILSFAIANAFDDLVAPLVRKIPFISNMITEGAEIPGVTKSSTFLDKINAFIRFFAEDMISDGSGDATQAVLKNAIAEVLVIVIAFVAVFVISLVIFKILFRVFDSIIKKIPVVKQANGLLGAIIGLFNGFIWTWVLSNIFVKLLVPVLNRFNPDFFGLEIANSIIVQFFTTINPITYLFWLINLIS